MAIVGPNFPVITWPVTIPDGAAMNVTLGSNPVEVVPIPPATIYGYESSLVGNATTGGLAGYIADVFNDYTFPVYGSAQLRASYEYDSSGRLVTKWTLQAVTGVTSTITFTGLDIADLGFTSSMTFTVLGSYIDRNDFNSVGYWNPNQTTCYDERYQRSRTYVTEGVYAPAVSTIRWGATKLARTLTFPTTYAAYIWLYRRTDSAFATPAGVPTDDPNNLLEYMYEAATEGAEFRVYESLSKYRTGYVVDQAALANFDEWVDDVSARGAIWEVRIPFLDTGSFGGAS